MTRIRVCLWPVALLAAVALAPGARAQIIPTVELKPETLKVWDDYTRRTEARIAAELTSSRDFLVADFLTPAESARARATLAQGGVFITKLPTRDDRGQAIVVPRGRIHHWLGSIFLPGAKLDALLAWVQDYDQHKKYFAEVTDSRLLERDGDRFRTSLRLKRKKIITVYYNTEHFIEYRRHSPTRVSSRSRATKIAELEDPDTPREHEKPVGRDSGFLWRLNTYWRYEEKDGGVVVECETVSLSRAVPAGLGWLIEGYVESVPRETLERTLRSLRQGLQNRSSQRPAN